MSSKRLLPCACSFEFRCNGAPTVGPLKRSGISSFGGPMISSAAAARVMRPLSKSYRFVAIFGCSGNALDLPRPRAPPLVVNGLLREAYEEVDRLRIHHGVPAGRPLHRPTHQDFAHRYLHLLPGQSVWHVGDRVDTVRNMP